MALYSMTQLLGKTILLDKTVDVYEVNAINVLGDKAKPVFQLSKGQTFLLDSFLAPRPEEKRTDGSIMYAKRSNFYFTFFIGTKYYAVIVKNDGRFSLNALKEQGALSVKEEEEKKKEDDELFSNPFKPLGNIFENIKPILMTVLAIILVIYLLPVILKAFEKK